MELEKVELFSKLINYKETIVVAGNGFSSREIYELKVHTSQGTESSELSPIEGFHDIKLSECVSDYQNNLADYKNWCPQKRYPIESALFNLSTPSLSKNEVYINGYFDPSNQKTIPPLECLKVKIGRDSFVNDKKQLQRIEDKRLRLDANRALNKEQFEAYLPLVFHYDYFEEPFNDLKLFGDFPGERFALDENVENKELQLLPQVVAFVLKPSLLGMDKTLELIKTAKKMGKRVVISSTFEGELGHRSLGRIAAYTDKEIGHREVHGLGTIGLLSNPLKRLGICVVKNSAHLTF